MKIGIDTRILTAKKTGVGYYINNLIPAILNLDKKNEYILFGTDLELKNPNCQQIIIDGKKKKFLSFLWKKFKYPKIEKIIGEVDLLFYPNFTILPSDCSNIIIVIHDLSYLKFPQYVENKNLLFLKKEVPHALKKAKQIVADSEATKKEIIKNFKISPEKILVIYGAISNKFYKKCGSKDIKKNKEKYKIRHNYLLFVGTLEPRKNIIRLLEAYQDLSRSIRNKYQLVLAGSEGWQDKHIIKKIKEVSDSNNRVIVPGYVPEEDLPALYSGAYLFLYPSFYEGFGMPILEAMACKTPVITSNTSSMPEVAGDAALLVNPSNIEEIKESIIKIINDSALRTSLIKRGQKQIQKFSWTKSAEKLIKVFEKVYKG